MKRLASTMIELRSSDFQQKHPLLFRVHIKSIHKKKDSKCNIMTWRGECLKILSAFSESFNNLVLNYLVTYPLGKIQFKWTDDARGHDHLQQELDRCMRGLEEMFGIVTRKAIYRGLYNDCYNCNRHIQGE